MSYVLRWTNPCRTVIVNAVIEDRLPSVFQVLRVTSSSPHVVEGNTVRIFLEDLEKAPSGIATIDVRMASDVIPGTALENTARLLQGSQVLGEATDFLVVREATGGRIACAFRAQVYARPGTPIRYAARYKNAGQNNVLTVSLPERGFEPSVFVPPPDAVAGPVLQYRNLARTAGLVRVDGVVAPDVEEGTILYAWATVENEFGHAAICEHRSEVRTKERLSLFLKIPAKWRQSVTTTTVARYNGATPDNELIMVLPQGVDLVSALPPPSNFENRVLRFQNLPAPAGLVKVRLQTSGTEPPPPGSQVVLSATITDTSGFVASSTTTATLLP